MVEDYGDVASDQEQQALEAFWVKENGLVIAHRKLEMTTALVDQGREISGRSCIGVWCNRFWSNWCYSGCG